MKSIRENSKEMITFSTCTDDEYTDMRKRTVMKSEWSSAAVLIIMVSPGFLQRLLKSNAIHFPTFPLKTKVYFFFCGVEIDCLEKNELKSRFHNYNSIQKHDHTKVVELVESVVQVLFHSDLNHPDYSRDPSTLQQSFRRSDLKKFDLIPKVVLLEVGKNGFVSNLIIVVNEGMKIISNYNCHNHCNNYKYTIQFIMEYCDY